MTAPRSGSPAPTTLTLGRIVLAGVLIGIGTKVLGTYLAAGTVARYAAAGAWGAVVFGAALLSLPAHAFRRPGWPRRRAVLLGSLGIGTIIALIHWLVDRAAAAA